jgi:predicted GTPase
MNTYQEQRQEIIKLFQQIQAIVEQNDRQDIAQTLAQSKQRFTEGKLFVVVAGEFKQGKSSLINALLNEKNLFPVDIDITTNLVSSITYGKEEKVTVVIGEPGQGQEKIITREEIPNYVTEQENANNVRKAQMLVIESPNPQLKEGLVLVDTPGVGGLNTEHTAVSYAFIPNADVILFVSDTEKPLTVKELEFVDLIARHCKNFIFVVTKKDQGNYKEIIASNREKLSKILNRLANEIDLIPVSSKTKIAYLKSKDSEDLEDSNFVALESKLWQILERQRGSILTLRALADLGKALAQIKAPIQVEWEAYLQTPNQIAEIEKQFQEIQQKLQNLSKNNSAWLTQLSDGLSDIKDEIFNQYKRRMSKISSQAEAYLEDSKMLAHPEEIISTLEIEINSIVIDLTQQISNLSSELQKKIQKSTGLNLKNFQISSLAENQENSYTFDTQKIKSTSMWEKTLNISQNASFKATIGATIGSLVGGFIGGGIGALFGGVGAVPGAGIGSQVGAFIGGLGGLVTGTKQVLSSEQDKTKRQILPEIRKFIEQNQQLYYNTLSETIKDLQRSMRNELTTQIQQEKETCDRTLQSLKESKKLTQEQTTLKMAELKPILQKINLLEQQIEQLAQAALANTEMTESSSSVSSNNPPSSNDDQGNWADE